MPVPKDLLDLMACPFCRSGLREDGEKLRCLNAECGLVFPVKDDIPIMLIDEAERPCPKCGARRDWQGDVLRCPSCGATLNVERKG
jgi:uncharacterized protein YbaR (Trm112 family)